MQDQMGFNEYQRAAMRTSTHADETMEMNLVHASLGMATEVGEFVTNVKRIHRYGKPLDDAMRGNMEEELGDLLWYVALAATALGRDLRQIAMMNIQKLRHRFPEKYSNHLAEARLDKGGLDATQS